MLLKKYGWAIQKRLFAETNQDSTLFHTRENSKIFNITSKYFSFFNNKPPASSVADIARDFLTCYTCSYYSSMITCFLDLEFAEFSSRKSQGYVTFKFLPKSVLVIVLKETC